MIAYILSFRQNIPFLKKNHFLFSLFLTTHSFNYLFFVKVYLVKVFTHHYFDDIDIYYYPFRQNSRSKHKAIDVAKDQW